MAATLGATLQQLIAEVEAAQRGATYATAEADLRQLRSMQEAWTHYMARDQKGCVEAFGAAVQHDAPTLNPSADAGFTRFLAQVGWRPPRDCMLAAASDCMQGCCSMCPLRAPARAHVTIHARTLLRPAPMPTPPAGAAGWGAGPAPGPPSGGSR